MTTPTIPQSRLRLLHVEDNLRDAELIHAQIRDVWPDCLIKRVDTRNEFVAAVTHADYDLILSDFTMPTFNGLDALDIARRQSAATPFMFLSGTIGESNAIAALQHGAVDYVIKDRPARLIPAIQRALVQRHEQVLRREAEEQLREQAGLLDKARDAICLANCEGCITYWNPSAATLFGWSEKSGQTPRLQDLFGPQLADALRQLQIQGAWSGDIRVLGKDKAPRHIESRWTLMRDHDGKPKSILSINTDITEQKQLKSQLLRSQRLEGIGTLAGGIAHDLNNILTPILMSVNMLKNGLQDQEMRRLVGVLDKSARQGAALVRQVLAFARGAEGERADVQLDLVVRDVVSLLAETLPRAISIKNELPKDLWMVRADTTQLGQVFMNLGVNARDAMPHGGQLTFQAANVTVNETTARAYPGAQSGPHVMVTVSDSGTGIPPELLNQIFDPFFTTKAVGKGTGLGLSTVLGIMKSHGGFLHVHSEVGHGTEFRLYFPAVPRAVSTPPFAHTAIRPHAKGETLLLIDDESGVREIAGALLRAEGYNVLTASTGEEGLALYRAHVSDVRAVITDMMMPGLQGLDVIRELRAIDPDVRIVAMSGISAELAAIPDMPGRLALVAKPMTGQDLIDAVMLVINSQPKTAA